MVHEDRIKALENAAGGGSLKADILLADGYHYGTLNIPDIRKYKIICILFQEDAGFCGDTFATSSIKYGSQYIKDGINANRFSYKFANSTTIVCNGRNWFESLRSIVGFR